MSFDSRRLFAFDDGGVRLTGSWTEINVDGLVGPTHHFGGLGVGNVASQKHHQQTSHPKQAALEGLRKAQLVASLGIPQFVLPPPARPRWDFLAELGFQGSPSEQLAEAMQRAPSAFSAALSSAFMWMANAATVTPACDAADGCLHLTTANLISSWHRGSEAHERITQLRDLFGQVPLTQIHPVLPAILPLRDEGAANHMRLCDSTGGHGVHLFVYGAEEPAASQAARPAVHFPRHTLAASKAIARKHQLAENDVFYLQQHPSAIDAGVFHNDVIATSCESCLIHHELAFLDDASVLANIESRFASVCGRPLQRVCISSNELPLVDAVQSYFFNSQILRYAGGDSSAAPRYLLLCPHHCQKTTSARKLVERLIGDPQIPLDEVRFVELSESMANGGGPACLRLRMTLSGEQIGRINPRYRLDSRLSEGIERVIELYPESFSIQEPVDAELIETWQQIDRAYQQLFHDSD